MNNTRFIVRAAVIAAAYCALTLVLTPISYGPLQVRVSEALTVLPLLFPEAIPGLAVGCALANIPMGAWDVAVGTFATLIAAVCTRFSKKIGFGVIPPIVINALLVPLVFLTMPEVTAPYWLNVVTIGAGQAISVLALGLPLYFSLKKAKGKYPDLFK